MAQDNSGTPPRFNAFDLYAAMSPAQLQTMLDGTLAEARGQIAGRDYAQADQLAQTPQPGGRNLGYTYVASNPMEHLAAAINGIQGSQGMARAKGEQNRQIDARGAGLKEMIALLQAGQLGQGMLPGEAQRTVRDPFSDVRGEGY
jgi:hypothetical protein